MIDQDPSAIIETCLSRAMLLSASILMFAIAAIVAIGWLAWEVLG